MLNNLFVAFVAGLGVALATIAIYPSTIIYARNAKVNHETKVFGISVILEVITAIALLASGTSQNDMVDLLGGLFWFIPALYTAYNLTKTDAFKKATK